MKFVQKKSTERKYLRKQEISSSNTIQAFKEEHFLNNLSPIEVYSKNATYLFNDQEVDLPISTVFEKHDDEEHIMAAYDGHNSIKSVIIHDKVRRRIEELVSIDDDQMATLAKTDYSSNSFSSLKNIFDFAVGLLQDAEETDETFDGRINIQCTELKVIDLAVVYDSSYCNTFDGKENAEAEIASIVSMVSKKFEQDGLCVKVKISYLEGYCDATLDPYNNMVREGVDSSDLLGDFRSFWIENRKDIERSVVHLFTATGMAENVIGRAYTGTICSKNSAFAIEEVSWSSKLTMKAAVVAHELGHNVGARHVDIDYNIRLGCGASNDFLMQPEITEGASGFNELSIEQMREVIESRSCMRTITL